MESFRAAKLRSRISVVLLTVSLSIVLSAYSALPKQTVAVTPSTRTQSASSTTSAPATAQVPPTAIHPPSTMTKQTSPAQESNSVIVYVTKTGEKYHRGGCRYLSKSKIQISLKDAKARGYDPCSVCKPQTSRDMIYGASVPIDPP